MNNKVKIFVIFLGYLAFAEAQFPTCNPLLVEWFSHPHECESYIICFHGVQHVLPCAPGLHFSPTQQRCMFPDEAQCHVNYMCPPVDDINNPVFLPDAYDCGIYYLCSRGSPIMRECAPGLWWDVNNNWCNTWDDVVCDNRTVINPGNPGNRTTLGPTTTTEMTTTSTTTTTTLPPTTTPPTGPNLAACWRRADLFHNGTYLKSSCIINTSQNYAAAEQGCRTNRMQLFVIDSPQVQTQFRNSTTQLLIAQQRGFVWINGRVDDECREWYTFNPTRNLMFSAVHWVQQEDFVGRNTGDCLRYTQQFNTEYFAMGVACNSASWYICEFSVPPVMDEF